jgi:hypothetical protein
MIEAGHRTGFVRVSVAWKDTSMVLRDLAVMEARTLGNGASWAWVRLRGLRVWSLSIPRLNFSYGTGRLCSEFFLAVFSMTDLMGRFSVRMRGKEALDRTVISVSAFGGSARPEVSVFSAGGPISGDLGQPGN